MNIEIKNRYTNKVIYSGEHPNLKQALEAVRKSGINLNNSSLIGSDLSKSLGLPEWIPVIDNIDANILAACTAPQCRLEMGNWHTCETTHCRAGWAVHLAGQAGKLLESQWGTEVAATLIYTVSRPGVRHPDFFVDNKTAMASIEADADTARKPVEAA